MRRTHSLRVTTQIWRAWWRLRALPSLKTAFPSFKRWAMERLAPRSSPPFSIAPVSGWKESSLSSPREEKTPPPKTWAQQLLTRVVTDTPPSLGSSKWTMTPKERCSAEARHLRERPMAAPLARLLPKPHKLKMPLRSVMDPHNPKLAFLRLVQAKIKAPAPQPAPESERSDPSKKKVKVRGHPEASKDAEQAQLRKKLEDLRARLIEE